MNTLLFYALCGLGGLAAIFLLFLAGSFGAWLGYGRPAAQRDRQLVEEWKTFYREYQTKENANDQEKE
jgi:hypothetical protein